MYTVPPGKPQQITQTMEIQQILQELLRSREVIHSSSGSHSHLISFRIQHVNIQEGLLSLMPLGDYESHQRLLQTHEMQLWTRHNNIRIAFNVERIGSLNSLSQLVSLPASITRYQQRYTPRLIPLYAEPLICNFIDHNNTPVSAQVQDICEGGIGFTECDSANELQWESGQLFTHCRLGLGSFGEAYVDLKLCHLTEQLNDRGMRQIHAGARFIDPSPGARQSIAQYRQHVELSRQRQMWRHHQPLGKGFNSK